ncbi:hypothetical protein RFI_15681, partial [Reticulomyxa filosa]
KKKKKKKKKKKVWHEGLPIMQGFKYIMRTDMMFQRVDMGIARPNWTLERIEELREIMPDLRTEWKGSTQFQKCEELYQASIRFQKEGKAKESTDAYLDALTIQAELHSLPMSSYLDNGNTKALPLDIHHHIWSFLDWTCIVQNIMTVCKSWQRMAQTSPIWKELFKREWPDMYSVERARFTNANALHNYVSHNHSITSPVDDFTQFERDSTFVPWYQLFKFRTFADRNVQVVAIHIQTHHVEYGMAPKALVTRRAQDVICKAPQIFRDSDQCLYVHKKNIPFFFF